MKVLRVIIRNIRDAFKSVFRNFSLSFASITCSSITLLLVAISLVLSININYITKQYENELTITAYMNLNISEEDIKTTLKQIDELDDVDNYEFISKEDWKKETQEDSEMLNAALANLSVNPLLDSATVKVSDVASLKKVATELKDLPGIMETDYDEGFVEKAVLIFDVIEKTSIVIVVALLLVTAFLIGNTIKLTIFSRRQEIEIMRLVGTSNLIIKMPFLFEGFILGVLGSLVPVIVTIYGYLIIFDRTGGKIANIVNLVKPFPFVLFASLFIIGVGALIGMFGSLRAVRKYLKI